jgi:hypothetical protein
MAQQTAIDWLVNQINGHSHSIGMPYRMSIRIDIPDDIIEQAKEMEKAQMFAYTQARKVIGEHTKKYFEEDFKNYYNETYNK